MLYSLDGAILERLGMYPKVSNLLWVRILSYFDPMGHVFLNRFFGGLSAVHYGGSK